jgi:hypothetical protein
MNKSANLILVLLFLANIFIQGCKKENDTNTTSSSSSGSIISGVVVDEFNIPLSGVDVTAYGSTVTTGTDGSFLFSGVTISNNRYVVNFSKTGYFSITRTGDITSGGSVTIIAGMVSKSSSSAGSITFNSSIGGVLLLPASGCQITFPANDFVIDATNAVYSGNVNAYAYYIDPSVEGFSKFIDGGDLLGKDISGNQSIIQMFSGLIIELLSDAGEKLNLNQSVKAACTVQFVIPSSLVGTAPDSLGIWGYSPSAGQQNQSGNQARSGDKVITQIGHFSSWSCSFGNKKIGKVTGTVRDENDLPICGVKIVAGQTTVFTDNNGFYTCKIPAETSIIVKISPDYYGNPVLPQTVNVSNNQILTLNFTVPALKYVTGYLKNCTGQAVRGSLTLTWSISTNKYFSTVLSKSDGSFTLPINPNAVNPIIYAYGNDTSTSKSVYDTTSGNINLGTLILCRPTPTGLNQYSIQGSNLFPVLTTFNSFTESKTANYSTQSSSTFIDVIGPNASFYIKIPGKATGTFTIGSAGTSLNIGINNPYYYGSFTAGTITVIRFDNVYGLVEGTFTASKTETSGVINITNGHFSVNRQVDTQ